MIDRNERENVTEQPLPHRVAAPRFYLPSDHHVCMSASVTAEPQFHGLLTK